MSNIEETTPKCKKHNDPDCECFIDMGPSSSDLEETTTEKSLRKLVNLIDEWRGDSTSLVDYMARADKGEEAINKEFIAKLVKFIESEKMRVVESVPEIPMNNRICKCVEVHKWKKEQYKPK